MNAGLESQRRPTPLHIAPATLPTDLFVSLGCLLIAVRRLMVLFHLSVEVGRTAEDRSRLGVGFADLQEGRKVSIQSGKLSRFTRRKPTHEISLPGILEVLSGLFEFPRLVEE